MSPSVELEIIPRQQFRAYLERKQRFGCLVCHRRAGKTYSCLQDILARALTTDRLGPPLRFGYIAPTRDQAKDIAWGYLRNFVQPLPDVTVNQAELSLVLHNGAQIRLYSGDSYDRMRGLYFDGVVIDEPADIEAEAWSAVIRPCLSDYLGWATFIGTPKGKNAFYERWVEATSNPDEWFSLILRASETGIIPPDELASLRAGTPKHLYAQEYECDFTAPIPGAIYAEEIERARAEGRISERMPVDQSCLVHTSWDLGSPLNTVVWYWQVVGRMIRVVDVDIGIDETLTQRVARMLGRGYNLGNHHLPHDAEARNATGISIVEELARIGLPNLRVIPRTHDVWVGINDLKELLPNLEFRMPACERGLEALSAYQRHPQADALTGVVRDEPIHNWASHAADALRIMAEAVRGGFIKFAWGPGYEPANERREDRTRLRRANAPMRVSGL